MSRPKRKKEGKPWDLGTVLIIIWVIRERAREGTERASPLAFRLRVRQIIRGHLRPSECRLVKKKIKTTQNPGGDVLNFRSNSAPRNGWSKRKTKNKLCK